LLNDAKVFLRSESKQRDERIKFSITDDVMSNFGDSIGLIFEDNFEKILIVGLILLGGCLLPNSVPFEFGSSVGIS